MLDEDPSLTIISRPLATFPLPHIRVCRLLPFTAWAALRASSCVQMTARRIFFIWSRHYNPDNLDDLPGDTYDSHEIVGYNREGQKVHVEMDHLVAAMARTPVRHHRGISAMIELLEGASGTISRCFLTNRLPQATLRNYCFCVGFLSIIGFGKRFGSYDDSNIPPVYRAFP